MATSRNVRHNQSSMNRRGIIKAFKIRGLTIQTSASDAILSILKQEDPVEHLSLVQSLADEIKERSIRNSNSAANIDQIINNQSIVTKSLITEIVAERSRNSKDIVSEALQLLNAFHMPRLRYDVMRKQFHLLVEGEDEKRTLHADAIHKVEMLLQRFVMIQQRVQRQECFRPKLTDNHAIRMASSGEDYSTTVLTPVESLLGRSGSRNLLGVLVQVEEGRYYLEDLTGQVPLDLSHATVLSDGLIGENCVVLIEGEMEDGILHVDKIGNPPPETREETVQHIGIQKSDIFGAFSSEGEMQKLFEQEIENGADTMFVVLSDVHLDKQQVLNKLEKLFLGFSEMSPLPVFILMGNFTSRPIRAAKDGGIRQVVGYYEQLGKLIAQFPNIAKEARFVLIPGPQDPGVAGGMLPHPPIPNFFTTGIKKHVSHVVFASNPCRLRFFTREFVFFREDIVGKLRGNCIVDPRSNNDGDEEMDVSDKDDNNTENNPHEKSGNNAHKARSRGERLIDHAIQTILDQGHLCPLPLVSAPVFWQYDHALRLYPIPDALILGDSRVDQFNRNCVGSDVMNPGSFSLDFRFVVYNPVVVDDELEVRTNVELSRVH